MSARDSLYRFNWSYLRGWLVIIVIVLIGRVAIEAFDQAAQWLEPLLNVFGFSGRSTGLTIGLLILVPWVLGRLLELPFHRFRGKRRNQQAFQQMQERLGAELTPGGRQGYPVVVVGWPNDKVRTLGVVTATFRDGRTDREMAAVFLPGTPDPTKGLMRVVAADDLERTDWSLNDLVGYHVTFGSASPSELTELHEDDAST